MSYPANTVVIKLSRPYLINNSEVEQLTMREPRVVDKIMFDKAIGSALDKEIAMITSLCGLNKDDLNNLPAYDYEELKKAFNSFLLAPEARGKNIS